MLNGLLAEFPDAPASVLIEMLSQMLKQGFLRPSLRPNLLSTNLAQMMVDALESNTRALSLRTAIQDKCEELEFLN